MILTGKKLVAMITTIIMILGFLGAGFAYVNDKYNELLTKQQLVMDSSQELSQKQQEFEKQRADLKIELLNERQKLKQAQDSLLQKESLLVEQRKHYKSEIEKELQEQLSTERQILKNETESTKAKQQELDELIAKSQALEKAYSQKLSEVKALYNEWSNEAILAKSQIRAEKEVYNLMTHFSELGVDLHHKDWCDKDYTKRYYQAQNTLSQISSIVRANDMENKFSDFVNKNRPMMFSSSDGICQK